MIYFNPRSPCGERPSSADCVSSFHSLFQSTLPLRGATVLARDLPGRCGISIHAPLAGSDLEQGCLTLLLPISIHAPLAGSDAGCEAVSGARSRFQSTLPLRGATRQYFGLERCDCDFNPRSPCGERRLRLGFCAILSLFQSTLPLRGATARYSSNASDHSISIHAPLAGSDWRPRVAPRILPGISIHAPLAGSDPMT